jgi:hypothetical protein
VGSICFIGTLWHNGFANVDRVRTNVLRVFVQRGSRLTAEVR